MAKKKAKTKNPSKAEFINAARVLRDGCNFFGTNDGCSACPLWYSAHRECQLAQVSPCDLSLPDKTEIQKQIKDLQELEKILD